MKSVNEKWRSEMTVLMIEVIDLIFLATYRDERKFLRSRYFQYEQVIFEK